MDGRDSKGALDQLTSTGLTRGVDQLTRGRVLDQLTYGGRGGLVDLVRDLGGGLSRRRDALG